MKLTKNIKRYMRGDDVLAVKEWLLGLGYLDKITNKTYGTTTYKAVRKFQKDHHLVIDGIVGKNTFAKLEAVATEKLVKAKTYVSAKAFPRLSEKARLAINEALQNVSDYRREMVLEALKYATDASVAAEFKYPSSLYIRGGNLFNKDGSVNVITEKYLTGSYKKNYKSFCTGGRLEMMVKAVKDNPDITGADCSGGIIGLLRHFYHVKSSVDASANGLCGSGYSTSIKKVDLAAGDFVGRSGHICLYVGGGYMVEWAGGAYGCQLTNMSDHRAWSFTKKKLVKQKACTKYRRPKFY